MNAGRDRWVSPSYFALLLIGALLTDGRWCFAATTAALVLIVCARLLTGAALALDIIWGVGFLYTISREGIGGGVYIIQTVGSSTFGTAAQLLCTCNALVLLALTTTSKHLGTSQRPSMASFGRTRMATLFVVGLYSVTIATTAATALSEFTFGRLSAERDIGSELVAASAIELAAQVVLVSVSTVLPALVCYELLIKRRRWLLGIAATLPIIALQIVLGTRYLLLLSVGGVLAVVTAGGLSKWTTRWGAYGAGGVGLLSISAIMARFRNEGLSTFSLNALGADSGHPLFNYEDVVFYVALLIRYCAAHGYRWGVSTGTILLFWVPRSLWATKPTLLGYWFPRELGLVHHFSGGYSAAVSFAGDAYLDFGFPGALLFSAILGVALGVLDSRLRLAIAQSDITLPLLGPLLGATFFAVRSLDTTLISYSGIVVVWLAYRALSRIRASPRPITQ